MARGFESKAVTDQQEAAEAGPRKTEAEEPDSLLRAKRRRLELSRSDVERRMSVARAEAHREILRRALEALDAELASLEADSGGRR